MRRMIATAVAVVLAMTGVFVVADSMKSCDPVRFHEVSLSEWDALIDQGWKGKDDGTDFKIYPIGC